MTISISTFLERQRRAAIFLKRNLEVVHVTPTAKKVLQQHKVIEVQGKDLIVNPKGVNKDIHEHLRSVLSNDCSSVLFFGQGAKMKPLRLELHSIANTHSQNIHEHAAIVILLDDATYSNLFLAIQFKEYFQLTSSEIKLVQSVYLGLSLKEHALSNFVQISTARWTLKNIFRKTGTTSQRELKALSNIFSG